MAAHTRDGVAGMSMCSMPSGLSASRIAPITAGGAPLGERLGEAKNLAVHLVPSRRGVDLAAAAKVGAYVDGILALRVAQDAGADEALLVDPAGFLTEAPAANLFLVTTGGELATPSLDCAILPGTTRSWLLAWAAKVGLTPVEGRLTRDDLHAADEAFLCSSVAGILPVTRFDGAPIGDGRPGPWTRRARADREAMIRSDEGPA